MPYSPLRALNRVQRITLILFVIVLVNGVVASFTGYSLIGGDLYTFFLIVFLFLAVLSLGWALFGKWFSRK